MKSGCFACDVVVEADDSEAVADLFIAHAAEAHEWDYPEHVSYDDSAEIFAILSVTNGLPSEEFALLHDSPHDGLPGR